MIVLTAVTDVELSSVHTSETFQATEASTVTVTNGTLVVNGTDSGTSAAVAVNDVLAVKATASSNFISTVFATAVANSDTYVFPLVSKPDPTSIYDQRLLNQPPLAHTETITNGSPWVPLPAPKLFEYTISTQASQTITIDRNVTGLGTTAVTEYIFLADYYDNVVYRSDTQGTTLQKITVGTNPIGLVYGKGPAPDERSVPYVINNGSNNLSRLSLTDYTEEATISVGQNPIAGIKDTSDILWVANFGSNTVSKIVIDQATQSVTSNTEINVGQGPVALIEDGTDIIVVCSGANSLSRINKTTDAVTSFGTGASVPWSITKDDSFFYVGHIGENKVTKIAKAGTLDSTFTVGISPAWLDHDGTSLFVADYEENVFYKLNPADGAQLDTSAIPATPYGIQVSPIDSDVLYIGANYANTPTRIKQRDYSLTSPLSYAAVTGAILDTDTDSNVFTVAGVDQVLPVSGYSTASSWTFLKNGTDVGQSTSVVEGDTLAVRVRSSSVNEETTVVAVMVGDQLETYDVTTLASNSVPAPFTFSGVSNNLQGAQLTAGPATISGLSDGLQLTVNTDKGELIKNGTVSGTGPITVQNGDTLDVRLTAGANFGDTEIAIIDMGAFDLPYVVQTRSDPTLYLASTEFENSRPTEFPVAYDGTDSNPKLLITDIATQITTEVDASTVPAEGTEAPTEFNNSNDYYLLPDTYGNQVLRASEAGVLVDSIALPADTNPKAIAFAPGRTATANTVPKIVVAGDTKVCVINHATWQVETTYDLPDGVIHGISGSRDESASNYEFAVVYQVNEDCRVRIMTATSSSITVIRDVGLTDNSKPLSIELDPEGQYFWITLVGTNQVVKMNVANYATEYFDVGRDPWGIVVTETDVYVTCALDGTLERYNKQDMTLTAKLQLRNTPYEMALDEANDKLYVTSFESNGDSIVEIDVSSGLTKTTFSTVVPPPSIFIHGIALTANNKLFSLKQYSGANSTRLTRPDTEPSNLLLDVFAAQKGQTFTSTAMTVTAVSRPEIRLRLPNLFGARFVVDGTEMTNDVIVEQGAEVQVRLDLINETNYRHNVPIIMEDYVYNWKVTTEPDLIPFPFSFIAKGDLFLNQIFESNEVTLDGMTENELTDLVLSAGTGVIVNNVDLTPAGLPETSTTVQVKQGDVFKIYGEAGRPYGQTAYHTADINGVSATFELTSKALDVLDIAPLSDGKVATQTEAFEKNSIVSSGPQGMATIFSIGEVNPDVIRYDKITVGQDTQTFGNTFTTKVDAPLAGPTDPAYRSKELPQPNVVFDLRRRRFVQQNITVLQLESARAKTLVQEFVYGSDSRTLTDPAVNHKVLTFDPILEKAFGTQFIDYSTDTYRELAAVHRYNPVNTVIPVTQHSLVRSLPHSEEVGATFTNYAPIQTPETTAQYATMTNDAYFLYGQQFTSIPELMWLVAIPFVPSPSTVVITVDADTYLPKLDKFALETANTYSRTANSTVLETTSHLYQATITWTQSFLPPLVRVNTAETVTQQDPVRAVQAVRHAPSGGAIVQAVTPRPRVSYNQVIAFVSNLEQVAPVFATAQDPWVDNGPLFTAADKNYYASQALAEAACTAAGYSVADCITIEAESNGWIWAHRADDLTEACGSQDNVRVRGWIRGG